MAIFKKSKLCTVFVSPNGCGGLPVNCNFLAAFFNESIINLTETVLAFGLRGCKRPLGARFFFVLKKETTFSGTNKEMEISEPGKCHFVTVNMLKQKFTVVTEKNFLVGLFLDTKVLRDTDRLTRSSLRHG